MNFLYRIGWLLFRGLFRIYFRREIHGVENVPLSGPVILASNHASFLDPPLVGSCLHREINYLARDTLFRFPIVGWVLREVNAVPVDREGGGAAGLKAILDRLLAGGGIILFPEGTRSADGNLQSPRAGIGLTVIKSHAPVVPVRIFGTFEAYSRKHKFPRPKKVIVTFGAPIDFSKLRKEAASCDRPRLKEIYKEVAEQIMQAIAALQPDGSVSPPQAKVAHK